MHIAQVMGGVHLHMRTCERADVPPPFRISETDGRIALKIGEMVRGPLAMRFTQNGGYPHERTCNCTHIKHICSLPLVHCPKGVLLVSVPSGAQSAERCSFLNNGQICV